MVTAELDTITRKCACCSRTNMNQSVRLVFRGNAINLGVTCAGRVFSTVMTGNKWLALDRLNRKLASMSNEAVDSALSNMGESLGTVQ